MSSSIIENISCRSESATSSLVTPHSDRTAAQNSALSSPPLPSLSKRENSSSQPREATCAPDASMIALMHFIRALVGRDSCWPRSSAVAACCSSPTSHAANSAPSTSPLPSLSTDWKVLRRSKSEMVSGVIPLFRSAAVNSSQSSAPLPSVSMSLNRAFQPACITASWDRFCKIAFTLANHVLMVASLLNRATSSAQSNFATSMASSRDHSSPSAEIALPMQQWNEQYASIATSRVELIAEDSTSSRSHSRRIVLRMPGELRRSIFLPSSGFTDRSFISILRAVSSMFVDMCFWPR